MISQNDLGIVLTRVNYGERDRIITFLCQQNGKVGMLAKSVRSQKSKLAGGTELLCVSQVSFVRGKSSLATLTGARLQEHFGSIMHNIDRMNMAFEILKIINKLCEDGHGQEYFDILQTAHRSLNEPTQDLRLIIIWFGVRVLHEVGVLGTIKPDGHSEESARFSFDHDDQRFVNKKDGIYGVRELKLLSLCLRSSKPPRLREPIGSEDEMVKLLRQLLKINIFEV